MRLRVVAISLVGKREISPSYSPIRESGALTASY